MKYTLKDMVQDVLSSMDADEVNSISDNVEAMQVARIIRACYFDILSTELPEANTIYQLEATTDSTQPVVMYRPSDVHSLEILKYNKAITDDTDPNFVLLQPKTVDDFFKISHMLDLSEDNVDSMSITIDGNVFSFLYRNDKAPDYYTALNEYTIVFDSYDATMDSTLQKSKTFCVGEKEKTFSLTDTYIIDLEERQHVWLLNEAKALAWAEMKQAQHGNAERTAKRQRIRAQKQKFLQNDPYVNYHRLPNYARTRAGTTNKVIMH